VSEVVAVAAGRARLTMPMAQLDQRERAMVPVVTAVVPFGLLVVLAGATIGLKYTQPASMAVDLVLCAVAAAWILGMFTLRPAWRVRPLPMAVFFAVFYALLAALVVRDSWFGFLCVAGYFFAFGVLPWPWRLLGVGGVAVLAGIAQASGIDKSTVGGVLAVLAVVVVNILPMCGFAWIDWRNDEIALERKRALAEVNAANDRLAATVAENAGLHEQLIVQAREAGVLDERARMAREIHDTIAQGLTGIVMQLRALEQAQDDPAEWRRHSTAAIRLARESLAEARRSVDALRPAALETAHLSDVLRDVATRWSGLHGLPVEVTTTGTIRPLSADTEFALLRTAQEALANVAKHAGASRIGVTLSYLGDTVALDVRDDGRGFDPARSSAGFGLVAMRERIEGLSGTLQVESEPGGGTAVSASVPVGSVR
jgi:signal transduction histidine kinase